MDYLFKRVPAGAHDNEPHNSCHRPFFSSRNKQIKQVTAAPAVKATGFARLALRFMGLYLAIIVIASMMMVKLSHATGTISATILPYAYPFVAPANTFVGYTGNSFPCGFDTTIDGVGKKCADYLNSNSTSQHFTYTEYTFANQAYPGGFAIAALLFSVATPPGSTPVEGNHFASVNIIVVCPLGYQYVWMNGQHLCEPQNQFSISLQIPPPTEVAPNTTKSGYALVTTSTGSPRRGVQVDLSLTVVPEFAGQLPVTYTGYLTGYAGAIGSTTYGGTTGTDGRLNFVFTAPMAGGLHTITATCDGCTNQATGVITHESVNKATHEELQD